MSVFHVTDQAVFKGIIHLAEVPGKESSIPVSYTHLDVYKRQGYYHAFSGNGGRFTLEWTLPVLIEDLERFCRDHVEFFVEGGGKPMAYGDQEGGFTTSLDGEDAETAGKIAIRLDRERLAEMKHARPQWYTSLPFLVSADEAVFKLQWRLKGVRSVDDQELARKNEMCIRDSSAAGWCWWTIWHQ